MNGLTAVDSFANMEGSVAKRGEIGGPIPTAEYME